MAPGSTATSKAYKNLQSLGAAFWWILKIGMLDEVTKLAAKEMTVYQLLAPLASVLSSSPVLAICQVDLQNITGNMTPQLQPDDTDIFACPIGPIAPSDFSTVPPNVNPSNCSIPNDNMYVELAVLSRSREAVGNKRKQRVPPLREPPLKRRKTCRCADVLRAGYPECLCAVEREPPEDSVERPMLEGLQASMNRTDAACTRNNGPRFRRHIAGVPPASAEENEFDLYVIQEEQWNAMSKSERVDIWGTGCDVFVFGLGTKGPFDVEESLSTLHRLDELMEVQGEYKPLLWKPAPNFLPFAVPGLRIPASEDEDGDYTKIVGTPDTLTLGHIDQDATRITVHGPGEKLWIRLRRNNRERDIGSYKAFLGWDPDKPDFQASYEGVILPPHSGTL
ncbi:hypothetical protein C8R46DRAFT_1033914 [Mycena filopes]|nr:hypothetical protein C8R46DRAFT_1033914 [Mycena filopes]